MLMLSRLTRDDMAPKRVDLTALACSVVLLANSWKFTPERDVAHISFGGETHNGESVFYVKDDGVGFDMRYAQKLFGAFQRSGLGRALPSRA